MYNVIYIWYLTVNSCTILFRCHFHIYKINILSQLRCVYFWAFSQLWIVTIVVIFNAVLETKQKLMDSSAKRTDAKYCDSSLRNKLIDFLNYKESVST